MNGIALLSLLVLLLSLGGIFVYNSIPGGDKFFYAPPYFFKRGDMLGFVSAFAFVLVFSLLFFGLATPVAMLVEGLKFGSLLSAGQMPAYDLVFLVPEIFAMLAATGLGEAVMLDYSEKKTIYETWSANASYLTVGALLLAVFIVLRQPVLSLIG